MKTEQDFIITRKQMKEIWTKCSPHLANMIKNVAVDTFPIFEDSGKVSFYLVDNMFGLSNECDVQILSKIFPGYLKDNNAFVKKFDGDHLFDWSEEMFGNATAVQIGVGLVPRELNRLSGRCLAVSPSYYVDIHKGIHDSTIIEIIKKK